MHPHSHPIPIHPILISFYFPTSHNFPTSQGFVSSIRCRIVSSRRHRTRTLTRSRHLPSGNGSFCGWRTGVEGAGGPGLVGLVGRGYLIGCAEYQGCWSGGKFARSLHNSAIWKVGGGAAGVGIWGGGATGSIYGACAGVVGSCGVICGVRGGVHSLAY